MCRRGFWHVQRRIHFLPWLPPVGGSWCWMRLPPIFHLPWSLISGPSTGLQLYIALQKGHQQQSRLLFWGNDKSHVSFWSIFWNIWRVHQDYLLVRKERQITFQAPRCCRQHLQPRLKKPPNMVEIYWTRPLVEPEVVDNKKQDFIRSCWKYPKWAKWQGVCVANLWISKAAN